MPRSATADPPLPPRLPRFRFFGGKGGVGKTTCAAAAAVRLAEAAPGRGGDPAGEPSVLVVSTDPAHSLGDALGVRLGAEPVAVPVRRGRLLAVELDARSALGRWLGEHREDLATLAERGSYLDRADVHRLLDLSLPGVDELIGLLELLRLAHPPDQKTSAYPFAYQEVVVDTAPTGHTLRLLAMPEELRRLAGALDRLQTRHRIVAESFGAWRPDASDALIGEIAEQGREIEELLRDPERAAFHWVLLPEALSVAETRDGLRALEAAGIAVPELIVNRHRHRLPPPPPAGEPCALCDARLRAEREALAELCEAFPGRAVRLLPELEREPRGLPALRRIGRRLDGPSPPAPLPAPAPLSPGEGRKAKSPAGLPSPGGGVGGAGRGAGGEGPPAWLHNLPAETRLLFFGGKGGVGKTTCAAAAALLLAGQRPERRVLLLSTDPAHSLADALELPLGDDERPVSRRLDNLRARELDAARSFAEWRARHLDAVEDWLEGAGGAAEREAWRDLLDLAPPGLDELSAVSALLDALSGSGGAPAYDLVIVDTAPTGHTLRLLETPAAMLEWVQALIALLLKYRDVTGLGSLAAELVELSRSLRGLLELLRDPARTGFLVVTRAAELPRRETVRLLAALDRLGLAVPALIVDAVLAAGCPRCDPAVRAQEREIGRLRKAATAGRAVGRAAERAACAIIEAPAVFPPPRGVETLAAWGRTWETRPD